MGFNFCSTDWRKQWPGSRKTSGSWGNARRSPDGPMLAFQFPVMESPPSQWPSLSPATGQPCCSQSQTIQLMSWSSTLQLKPVGVNSMNNEEHYGNTPALIRGLGLVPRLQMWSCLFNVSSLGTVLFLWGSGAGGIWRKAPVVYDDPPHLQKIFRVPPFFPKIIEMTPPPPPPKKRETNKTKQKTRKLKKKERFLFLFVNLDTVLYRIQLLKKEHQHFTN